MSAKEKKDQPVGSVKETDFHEDVHMLFRRDAGPGRAGPTESLCNGVDTESSWW